VAKKRDTTPTNGYKSEYSVVEKTTYQVVYKSGRRRVVLCEYPTDEKATKTAYKLALEERKARNLEQGDPLVMFPHGIEKS